MKTPLTTTIALIACAVPLLAQSGSFTGSVTATGGTSTPPVFILRTENATVEIGRHEATLDTDGTYSIMESWLSTDEGEWQWKLGPTATSPNPLMTLSDMAVLSVWSPANASSRAQLMGNGSLLLTNTGGGTVSLMVEGSDGGARRLLLNDSLVLTENDAYTKTAADARYLRTTTPLGVTALLFGTGSIATGDHALSLGKQTESNGEASVAMGKLAIARANTSVAIGYNTYAGYAAPSSVVIGHSGVTNAAYSVSLGLANQTDGAYSTAVGWGNWTKVGGVGGTALGALNRVEGNGASAIGAENTARGPYSTAIGYQSQTGASAWGALSVGNQNIANSPASTAIGQSNITTGYASVATGMFAHSDGYNSSAMGIGTVSKGPGQFVVGAFNAPLYDGNGTMKADNDALFIVGNGYQVAVAGHAGNVFTESGGAAYDPWQTVNSPVTTTRRNAFVVRWNGNTEVNGNLEVKLPAGASPLNAGNITAAGSVTSNGTGYSRFKGPVLIPESGDISMGDFTEGPQP